jgi:hypothetical protein
VPFQSRYFGNIAVATPAGRLDQSAAADFEQALLPLVENSPGSSTSAASACAC